ncbi:hypothetical protein Tco_0244562, partial [Tanacetum coccineum]
VKCRHSLTETRKIDDVENDLKLRNVTIDIGYPSIETSTDESRVEKAGMTMLKIRVLMEKDTLQVENVKCPSGYSHILFNDFVLRILPKYRQ